MKQIVLILLLFGAGPGLGDIFRWVDEQGNVHFSDQPSREHQTQSVEVSINTYENVSVASSSLDVGRQIVMYSASWCGVCKQARRYFTDRGLNYVEHDVEKSVAGKAAFQRLGATGVPVILVGDRRMNGFSVAGFEKLLN